MFNKNFTVYKGKMIIGIPKEIKDHEYRVGATPAMVALLVQSGHRVLVETLAGAKIGFSDEMYRAAGAEIVANAAQVYEAEMIVKVKELQKVEFPLLKAGQILFCYLHLAPDPIQAEHLIKAKVVAFAYEMVTDQYGKLPLLRPMSEIAGRMAVQIGAYLLEIVNGGKGILLGGVPGVPRGNVVVIGAGVAGTESLRMAIGLGANVTVIDKDIDRLRTLDMIYSSQIKTIYSNPYSIEEALSKADLVIGAVLLPGKKAPQLIKRPMISKMSPGSVFVDIAIDQGGCSETSKPTTHTEPTYLVDGVIHYCVTNMPGACARTATEALTNATMNDVLLIANKGYKKAIEDHPHLFDALNVYKGHITNEAVARELELPYLSYHQQTITKTS